MKEEKEFIKKYDGLFNKAGLIVVAFAMIYLLAHILTFLVLYDYL